MKQGAIFDMDGLLFDTEQLYQKAWVIMAKQFGHEPDPNFPRAISGSSGQAALDAIHRHYPDIDPKQFWDAGVKWVLDELKKNVPLKPGAREIVDWLQKQGVKLAVASSSHRTMVEGNLHRSGFQQYFPVIVSGEDAAKSKPAPDSFLIAARKLNLPPENCYVFEDSLNGVRAGAAAGCGTIMVPDFIQPPDDVRAMALRVCDSLLDALALLQQGVI